MISTRLTALTVAGALSLAACGSADGATEGSGPIKIGVVVPLTGPYSPLGTGDKAAIEQEVEAINDAGGVLGRDLEVTIKDDKTDVPQSVTEFNQLAADPSYTAILSSSFVSASTAVGPSAESNKIPTIALGPVSAFADGSNPYAFTGCGHPGGLRPGDGRLPGRPEGTTRSRSATPARTSTARSGTRPRSTAAEEAGIEVVLDEPFDQTRDRLQPAGLQGRRRPTPTPSSSGAPARRR